MDVAKPTRHIRYEGKSVAFRALPDGRKFVAARRRLGHIDVCPLCKTKFTLDTITGVVLVVSNQAGIPNRFVHQECLEDKTDEYAFRLIVEDWNVANQHRQQCRDWFPTFQH